MASDARTYRDAPIRVIIADDQALVRAGIRRILEADPAIEVSAEAADGLQVVSLAARAGPDVVVLDVRMPELDGIEATRRIIDGSSEPPGILILTTYGAEEYVFEALRAGASGFVLKDAPPEELVAAVKVIATGDALLAPSVTHAVIREFVRQSPSSLSGRTEADQLTKRELEVLMLIAKGLSNAEIGEQLFISPATVKTHVAHLLRKLGVRSRAQAVIYAYESGLIRPGGTAAA